MDVGRMGLRGMLIAALIAGFALALWFLLNELEGAMRDVCSSLATVSTIGN
ncbi:hypothetical protein ACVWVY_004161 [Bradyrhizobium sp. URHC0002]